SIITMGLRGANDTPMAPGGPEANMALLGKIVEVQRKIIAEEMNPDVTKVPQLWCLYKEVQDFYNAGMRVPDDVTLLWPRTTGATFAACQPPRNASVPAAPESIIILIIMAVRAATSGSTPARSPKSGTRCP